MWLSYRSCFITIDRVFIHSFIINRNNNLHFNETFTRTLPYCILNSSSSTSNNLSPEAFDLLDCILQLLDTNVFDEIKGLLQPIISQQPAYFLLLLLYHPSTSYMKRYLLEQLLLQVLCLSISFDVMEILQKAILPYKQLIVEIIELFLRTNDSIPDAMLININQLNLQESLLAVFDYLISFLLIEYESYCL